MDDYASWLIDGFGGGWNEGDIDGDGWDNE